MEAIFSTLAGAVAGSVPAALAGAFAWGVLSVIISPCHLASIPLIVGFIEGQGRIPPRRAFTLSLLFSLGILITIGLVGAATAAAGRLTGDVGSLGNYLVAGIFLLVGLHLLGFLPLPWARPGPGGLKLRGVPAAFILGLIFGIGLGPCTFAFLAPLLAVVFSLGSSNPGYAVFLLLLYGLGHCSVIVLAGTLAELVQRYLNWSERSRGPVLLRIICGILVILGGFYLIYSAP